VNGKDESLPFAAKGDVSLLDANITGGLEMDGAQLEGRLVAERAMIGGAALLRAWNGKVNGKDESLPFTAKGDVFLSGANITGGLAMDGAQLEGRLVAERAMIGGAALLRAWDGKVNGKDESLPFAAKGDVSLLGANITGGLEMSGARLEGRLVAERATIGGSALLRAWDGKVNGKDESLPFVVKGDVSLRGANITRNLDLRDARLEQGINLYNATIDGSLQVRSGDKECAGYTVFDLRGAKMGALEDEGGAGFSRGARLYIEGFQYTRLQNASTAADLDYLHRFFGSAQGAVRKIRPMVWPVLMVAAGVAGVTGLMIHAAWAVHASIATALCFLLWVFVSLDFEPQVASVRLKWLRKQYSNDKPNHKEYSPSAYERLSKYFRDEGLYDDARRVTIEQLTLERKFRTFGPWRPFVWLFGVCFDYGLSPLRAVTTFIVLIFVGWGAATVADQGLQWTPPFEPQLNRAGFWALQIDPVLEVTTSTVNSVATPDRRFKFVPALAGMAKSAPSSLACGNQIEPLLYAIDTFVPAINLDQNNRCSISNDDSTVVWRIGKAAYTILGWIVTSLTILTVSGILRRQAES